MMEKILGIIPLGTVVGSLFSMSANPAPSLHWAEITALLCGAVASISVAIYHFHKWRK